MVQFEQTQTKGTRMGTGARNPKLKTAILQSNTSEEPTPEQAREKRMAERIQKATKFSRPLDIVANDSFCLRNEPIPKGKEMFPVEYKMQYADWFYPYATADGKPAPLYADVASNVAETALCERKYKALQEKGIRYTYIKSGEGASEALLRLDGKDPDKIKADQRKAQFGGPA